MKKVTLSAPQTRKDADSLAADTTWAAVSTATPAQIDTWLNSNVSNLADARRILRLLIIATRHAIAQAAK
jgi:hypothetical protein